MSVPASLYDCDQKQLGPYLRKYYEWEDEIVLAFLAKNCFSGKTLFLLTTDIMAECSFPLATVLLLHYILEKEPKKLNKAASVLVHPTPELSVPVTLQSHLPVPLQPSSPCPLDVLVAASTSTESMSDTPSPAPEKPLVKHTKEPAPVLSCPAPPNPAAPAPALHQPKANKARFIEKKDISAVYKDLDSVLLNRLMDEKKVAECRFYMKNYFVHLSNKNIRRIPCPFQDCAKDGKTNFVRDHVLREHLNITNFHCGYCKKEFKDKKAIVCHFKSHVRADEGHNIQRGESSSDVFPFCQKDITWQTTAPSRKIVPAKKSRTDLPDDFPCSSDDENAIIRPLKRARTMELDLDSDSDAELDRALDFFL